MAHGSSNAARREDAESTILIASQDVLATWSATALAPTDILALADADAQHALAVIERRRPHIVILEQIFAASKRGAALISQLRTSAQLAGTDIRVLSAARSATLGASGPVPGHVLASMAQPLQQGTFRRAPRITLPKGAEMRLDGGRAALINVSTFGLQVVSPTVLKPNQKVEIIIDRYGVDLRTRAEIAWSVLELGQSGVSYRAGIAFAEPQPELLKFETISAGVS
jgi:hypothetical protein